MSEFVPDPTSDRKPGIVSDEYGTRLAPPVFIAPAGTPPPVGDEPGDDWIPVGWFTGPPPTTDDRKATP